jgi:hypothetical protein
MPKFRETNWFKRGELVDDSMVETTDGNVERPIEDRYLDEGTTSSADSVLYGIHTGQTTKIPSARMLRDHAPDLARDDARYASAVIAVDPKSAPDLMRLVAELKQRNRTLVAVCGAAMVALAVFVGVVA